MSEDQSSSRSQGSKSWLERISQAFSSGPETVEDVLEILRDAETESIIDPDSMNIIEGAIQVIDMRVDEIMIPRSQMITVKASSDPKSFLGDIINSAHSRFPVIGDSADDVIGILLAKDLLGLAVNNELHWPRIREILRPPTFVPESKRLNQLLKEFRETRNHMAIVVDEYGGTAGLVTIEDVLEQIVGEIEDEHDVDEETNIKGREDGSYSVKAVTSVEDFNEFFNCKLDEEEFDTIGGLVLKEFGHLPRRGEQISFGGFQFTIANADNRSIRLLQVTPSAV
ncbi:MAG: CBS domain-containing protein [Marinobacter sp.]|nr:CBS domain-containing protein [Marinobacter sp.]